MQWKARVAVWANGGRYGGGQLLQNERTRDMINMIDMMISSDSLKSAPIFVDPYTTWLIPLQSSISNSSCPSAFRCPTSSCSMSRSLSSPWHHLTRPLPLGHAPRTYSSNDGGNRPAKAHLNLTYEALNVLREEKQLRN